MTVMKENSRRRKTRSEEWKGLWDRLPQEVLLWLNSLKKEDEKEDRKSGLHALITKSIDQEKTCDQFFMEKYNQARTIRSN